MIIRYQTRFAALFGVLIFMGCGGGPSDQERLKMIMNKDVSAVTPAGGTVLVDGNPGEQISILVYTADGSKQIELGGKTATNNDGKFAFTTYSGGDGLLAGEYKLVFVGKRFNKKKGAFEGADSLNDRYSDPHKSEFKLDIESGKPQKDLKFELTTK